MRLDEGWSWQTQPVKVLAGRAHLGLYGTTDVQPQHPCFATSVLPLQNYHSTQISMSRYCREGGNTLAFDRPASGAKRDLKPSREAPIAQPDGRGLSLGSTTYWSQPDLKETAQFAPHFGRDTILNAVQKYNKLRGQLQANRSFCLPARTVL